jgi:hypothetical protein
VSSESEEVREEVRSELVCFRETDIVQGSRKCEQEFFVRHSRREDARGPERNRASRRQSVIVSCQNCNCKGAPINKFIGTRTR